MWLTQQFRNEVETDMHGWDPWYSDCQQLTRIALSTVTITAGNDSITYTSGAVTTITITASNDSITHTQQGLSLFRLSFTYASQLEEEFINKICTV